jgi:hypothetical protein
MVRNLCEQNAKPDARNARGETALHWACIKGNAKAVHILASEFHADLFAADSKGYSCMHFAAQNGHTLVLAMLHRKGASCGCCCSRGPDRTGLAVNVRDNDMRTPLHWAAYKNHTFTARWLLAHGADPGALDWENCLPVHWAALRGHAELLELLLELGGCGWVPCLCALPPRAPKLTCPHASSRPQLTAVEKTGGTPLSLAHDKIGRLTSVAGPLDDQTRITVRHLERVVSVCVQRAKVEELVKRNAGKPTWGQRMRHKSPHISWFFWPIMAPLGCVRGGRGGAEGGGGLTRAAAGSLWQYWATVLPATSHLIWAHLVFVVCYVCTWYFWARLQTSDPGDVVEEHPGTRSSALFAVAVRLTHALAGARRRGVGAQKRNFGWRKGFWPQYERFVAPTEPDVRATLVSSNEAVREFAQAHRDLCACSLGSSHQQRGGTDRGPCFRNPGTMPFWTTPTTSPSASLAKSSSPSAPSTTANRMCAGLPSPRSPRALTPAPQTCVLKFDHFCPFFNAVIGEQNYVFFLGTAACATACMWAWLGLVVSYTLSVDPAGGFWGNLGSMPGWCVGRQSEDTDKKRRSAFAWSYAVLAVYGLMMGLQHVHLSCINLSTNELINGGRYRYLTEDGVRGNPFNRGMVLNAAESLALVPPLRMLPHVYYEQELLGGPCRFAPLPAKGSRWFRPMMITNAGQVMGGPGSHAQTHGAAGDHGHSHEGGGGHGHSH